MFLAASTSNPSELRQVRSRFLHHPPNPHLPGKLDVRSNQPRFQRTLDERNEPVRCLLLLRRRRYHKVYHKIILAPAHVTCDPFHPRKLRNEKVPELIVLPCLPSQIPRSWRRKLGLVRFDHASPLHTTEKSTDEIPRQKCLFSVAG